MPENESSAPRILGSGRYLELVDEDGWEYVRRHTISGVAVIVATTDTGEVVLVEQPRRAIHARTIELPAGLVGDLADSRDESMSDAAHRELVEETGFRARDLRVLFEGPTSVGMSSEVVTFFRATGLDRVGPGGGDDNEDITVHVVRLDAVGDFIRDAAARGLAIDPKVYTGLYFILTEGGQPSSPTSTTPPR